jgi:hypothetical protein
MRIILKVGANLGSKRFEASDQPQDVPTELAKAMLARGAEYAEKAPTSSSAKPTKESSDE